MLNIVMIFVLTSRSHYNTIIESRDHFLLSFEWSIYRLSFTYDSIYDRYLLRRSYT